METRRAIARGGGKERNAPRLIGAGVRIALAAGTALQLTGCLRPDRSDPRTKPAYEATRVVVVAPVINLSGDEGFDALQVTDILAAELASQRAIAVIPVNLALAALERRGKSRVESPEEALALAREFGADAAVVAAVTDYDPYHPPTLGMILQWYAPVGNVWEEARAGAGPAADVDGGPYVQWQVQRVFRGSDEALVEELKEFGKRRNAHESPYDWQQYAHSQKAWVRFSCWSAIRTMLEQNVRSTEVQESHRATR